MGNIETVEHQRRPIFPKKLYAASSIQYQQPYSRRNFYVPPESVKSIIRSGPRTDRSLTTLTERK